jgi:OOP family OmpA-OmpF porin
MNYLVSKGIDASRLSAAGYGEEKPVASNDTKEGRALNRRSELKLSN